MSEDTYDDDKYVLRKHINSNSNDGNENNDDTFHDAIQVEEVMDDTDYDDYENNDCGRLFQSIYRVDSNINLLQIVLSIFLQHRCKWILKKYCLDNIKFDQKKELKSARPNECCFIMKRKDGECHMKAKFNAPDPLDYLDSICSNPDPLKLANTNSK